MNKLLVILVLITVMVLGVAALGVCGVTNQLLVTGGGNSSH